MDVGREWGEYCPMQQNSLRKRMHEYLTAINLTNNGKPITTARRLHNETLTAVNPLLLMLFCEHIVFDNVIVIKII